MHAVILALNARYIHSSLAPWYLRAGTAAFCAHAHTVRVAEGTINQSDGDILALITDGMPDVVALSCYIWNIATLRRLLPDIRRLLPDAAIVLGGPEATYNAKTLLRETAADYVLAGEGERPFALLLDALASGDGFDSIPGLCRVAGDRLMLAAPYSPADEPPNPYTPDYFQALGGRIAYLETSRGCPFHCAFCLSGFGAGVRFFRMERAKRDLLALAASGTKTVKLVDRTFNADKARAREIFAFIIGEYKARIPEGVCFHFEIAGDLLDDETLSILSAAPPGLIQFEIGVQSFNEKTLDAVCRKTDMTRLISAVRRLIALGTIHVHIDLIAGLPHEDIAAFAASFNAAYALGAHQLQLGFLKLLHGAPMRRDAMRYPCRYSDAPPYEVAETPWLTADALSRLRHIADAVDKLNNTGRFRRTLAYVLDVTRLTPFELFDALGEQIVRRLVGASLDALTAAVQAFFAELPNVDADVLRDNLVLDRLSTNRSGKLPTCLRLADRRLKRAAAAVAEAAPGKKLGIAILCARDVLVAADYTACDPVTGAYPITQYPMKSNDTGRAVCDRPK